MRLRTVALVLALTANAGSALSAIWSVTSIAAYLAQPDALLTASGNMFLPSSEVIDAAIPGLLVYAVALVVAVAAFVVGLVASAGRDRGSGDRAVLLAILSPVLGVVVFVLMVIARLVGAL